MYHLHYKAFLKAWGLSHAIYKEEAFFLLWKNKLRFSVVSLLSAVDSTEWFSQLSTSTWIQPVLERIPVLAFKPMRAYLSTEWDFSRRKKVIWDSYELLRRYPVCWSTLLSTEGTELARFEAENHGKWCVILRDCHHSTSKEGEVMVILRNCASRRDLFKTIFSFEKVADGSFNCYIGCIQGMSADSRDEIKAITKAMHGLRPTSLMIFVVREIIAAMGIEIKSLLGSGNQIHPFKKKHLIHLPFVHQINFNYDALWEDAGGVPAADGWFRLPVTQAHRKSNEIKSKKKMLYQRRYALMDDMAKQIRDAVRGDALSGS
jgi:hypothetical protein